jgi:hypothetical protein
MWQATSNTHTSAQAMPIALAKTCTTAGCLHARLSSIGQADLHVPVCRCTLPQKVGGNCSAPAIPTTSKSSFQFYTANWD